jgi:hypothetical protein
MRIAFLIPLLVTAAACSLPPDVQISSSPSPVRDSAVGCWRLESSPGLWGRPLPPTLVRLDTARSRIGGMRMILIPAPDPRRNLNYWGTSEDGTRLMLAFGSGFSGVVVHAAIRGDQLRGRGRTWVDVPAVPVRGPVRGVRVPCPAEPAAG